MSDLRIKPNIDNGDFPDTTKKFIFQYWEDGGGCRTWYYGPKMNSMIGIKNYKIIKQEDEGVRDNIDEDGHRYEDFLNEIESIQRFP